MYDHYIAVDWAKANMAISRMTKKSNQIKTIDVPSDLNEFKIYLKSLKGSKILTFEETTTSQWLYVELKSFVDEIIVCNPRRNQLLSEGPKNDKIDSQKLVQLLRADLVKPVFHSGDELMQLRKFVSGYEDVVKSGVRLQSQRFALFQSKGQDVKDGTLSHKMDQFVLAGLEESISLYEKEKKRYQQEFSSLGRKHKTMRNLDSLPGIGTIHSGRILAIVIDPKRFPSRNHFLSYCGLVKLQKMSGGKSYGKKNSEYNRSLKTVFKQATLSAIKPGAENDLRQYYDYLLTEKHYQEHNARHSACRRLATLAFGIMKTKKKFKDYRGKKLCSKNKNTDL